ncbi:hypothetical protein COV15_01485 [Candidatus Woesearchaeota archaeon CG10_big_fil_rev_8_21_14_0_10_34_12]|nr:MAG: hypothetical protein COV15_01485 [Candidatus Woesearchaeota archaeon CG10_big_fil_rev_8_21_14_0_10_34_12]
MRFKPFVEKYRPKNFKQVKGQGLAIGKLDRFMKTWPAKKACILHGPPGTGKTTLAYTLAYFLDREIFELNASDFRTKDKLNEVLRPALKQESLFKKNKIILIDEVDGIVADRGGLSELIYLIESSHFPVIITANDIWGSNFAALRKISELIPLGELDYRVIFSILEEICKLEGISVDRETLIAVAIKSKGDVRAAINDLQSLCSHNVSVLSERDKMESIFNVLRSVFKSPKPENVLDIFDKLDMPLDEVFLWIEENIPYEYQGKERVEELYKAVNALSMADVYRGRVRRQNYWRFFVYQSLLLSAGINIAKKKIYSSFTTYKRPTRVLKIWMSNQKNKHKKSVIIKYAKHSHMSKKKTAKEFFLLPYIINPDISHKLRLTEDEEKFLNELTEAHLPMIREKT